MGSETPSAEKSGVRTRLRAEREFARFAFHTLIAPWPPFAVLLVVTGVIGGLTPLVLIRATAGLVDALTARHGMPAAPGASWIALLRPYLPWLLLFIGMRIVNWLITMDSYQRYVTAQLNERVRERFDRPYLGTARS